MPATTPPTRMQLQSKLKQFEDTLDTLRVEQDGLPSTIKRLSNKVKKLEHTSRDEATSENASRAAQLQIIKILPDLRRSEARRDALPDLINEKEVNVIEARNALRDFDEDIEERRIARALADPADRPKAAGQRQGMALSGAGRGRVGAATVGSQPKPAQTAKPAQKDAQRRSSVPSPAKKVAQAKVEKRKPKGKELKWKGTANLHKVGAVRDAYLSRQRASTVETNTSDRVLREKSTNDDVTTSRGRSTQATTGQKRAQSPSRSPSPPPLPVNRARRHQRVVHEDDSEDEGDAPECATSTEAKEYTAPTAQMASATGSDATPKGTKRTASWSVGDAIAPDPKKQKTGPEGDVGRTVRAASEEGEIVDSDITETSNSDSSTSANGKSVNSGTPASSASSEINEESSTTGKKTSRSGFKGIKNIGQSCFSGVIIQLIDAALEGRDLDHLLGELVETENFGITDEECRKIEAKEKGMKKINDKKRDIRLAVKVASMAKNVNKVSVARHLRKLLEDLREENDDKNVSAFRFQAVVAEGDQSDRVRKNAHGDDQEDASEYFTSVMRGLDNDPNTSDATYLKRLFDIAPETIHRCLQKGCGYESAPRLCRGNNNQHHIPVAEPAKFSALFASSKHSVTDRACPKCGKGKLRSSTKFTNKPANFVVSLDRTMFDRETGKTHKNRAAIHLDQHELKIDGVKYALSAVVFHQGSSPWSGHFIIFRKQGEDWYKIDDAFVSKPLPKDALAKAKNGQCSMLLFKKQQ